MGMKKEYATAYAVGYFVLGVLILLMKDSAWWVFLSLGLLGIAMLEYMAGGYDGRRNWLFMFIFIALGIAILLDTAHQYWILVGAFIAWGAYEVIEERVLNSEKWDAIGVASLLVGGLLVLTGLMGNTYEPYLAMAFGIMFSIQGLKEWFD